MNPKKVVDKYGREVVVDLDRRTICGYNNEKKEILYNVKLAEDNEFFTDYVDTGVVEDLETRVKVSYLNSMYASAVGYKSTENDPEKEIWRRFVEWIKEDESLFFKKNGDIRKRAKKGRKADLYESIENKLNEIIREAKNEGN